jgi:hypothetical protein
MVVIPHRAAENSGQQTTVNQCQDVDPGDDQSGHADRFGDIA